MEENTEKSTKKKKGSCYCAAFGCTNGYSKGNTSLHRFPKDSEQSRIWVRNTGLQSLEFKTTEQLHNNYRLCSQHFEQSQFIPDSKLQKLIRNAEPTIFSNVPLHSKRTPSKRRKSPTLRDIPSKRPKILEHSNEHLSTVSNSNELLLSASNSNPEDSKNDSNKSLIQKLREKCCKQQRTITKLKSELNIVKNSSQINSINNLQENTALSEIQRDFILAQMNPLVKSSKGFRWPDSLKTFSLSIHYTSPAAYRILKENFNVPSVSTIKNSIAGFKCPPGFDSDFIKNLEYLSKSLLPIERFVNIVLDFIFGTDQGRVGVPPGPQQ